MHYILSTNCGAFHRYLTEYDRECGKPECITYWHVASRKKPLESLAAIAEHMEKLTQEAKKSTLKIQMKVVPIRRREGKKVIEQGLNDITGACAEEDAIVEIPEMEKTLLNGIWTVHSKPVFQGSFGLSMSKI